MRFAACLLFVALAAGCSSHSAVAVGGGVPPSGPVAPAGSASISTGSGAAALGLVLIFGTLDYVNNPQPLPNPASLFSPAPPPAPELATGRRISEQDCSKPVDITLGNLRCK